MLGVTSSQISAFSQNLADFLGLAWRFSGLYLLCFSLVGCYLSLEKIRKGEKWAWYLFTAVAGIAVLGQLGLFYVGLPDSVPMAIGVLVIWIAGTALSAKEIFMGKKAIEAQ